MFGLSGRYGLWDLVDLRGRMEWRRYGGVFNAGRTSSVRFRGNTSTIGPYLYPLDYLERPFSNEPSCPGSLDA